MAKTNVCKLAEQREKSMYSKLEDLREFFETLDEAVAPFKSGYKMPGANAGDSRFSMGNKKGRPIIKFQFLAKPNHDVTIDVDIKNLAANPDEYIDNMLECLSQGMDQATKDNVIIVPNAFNSAMMTGAIQ